MTSQELYREGKLREAVKALGNELRSNPLDAKRRTFLFELLLFAGEFDRAEKQLDILAGANAEAAAGTLLYRSGLYAERTRQVMFANRETPASRSQAVYGGILNGKAFNNFIDADPRIGANLEVFIAGSYTWIPMCYLRRLEVEPPVSLRDLVWARARVETSPEFRLQEIGEVLLPVLCPLSSRHPDESVQLGRESAWEPDDALDEIPYGSKMMVIDGTDVPLLDVRSVTWSAPGEESHDASAR
ncbi:MAG: type VI secretion system accessory protein TagJ [Terracidiphilus sp.]|jgi:type VI secretion system protein ImpE